jgi:hypothetical protein
MVMHCEQGKYRQFLKTIRMANTAKGNTASLCKPKAQQLPQTISLKP